MRFTQLLFPFSLLLLVYSTSAQSRFSIELGGGFAFPVGDYAQTDLLSSSITQERAEQNIVGFRKENNGMAKSGYSYFANLSYKVSKSFILQFEIGQIRHQVETDKTSDFLTEHNGFGVQFTSQDYVYTYYVPAIVYSIEKDNWLVSLGIQAGPITAKYAEYSSQWASCCDFNWSSTNEESNLNSTLLGTRIEIAKQIARSLLIGVNLGYQGAKFEFTQSLVRTPITRSQTEEDLLSLKTLNFGIKMSYHF